MHSLFEPSAELVARIERLERELNLVKDALDLMRQRHAALLKVARAMRVHEPEPHF